MKKLDRGNKLWHMQFVLPEHIEALQKWYSQQDKVPKPNLDEQELTEIGYVVMDSLSHEIEVKVTYWDDGYYKEIFGVVGRVDQYENYIKVDCLMSFERIWN